MTSNTGSKDQVVAYIGRHGTTALNESDRYRGQADVPLDDQGKQDAKAQAKFMADKPIGQAWTSNLSRSKDTAKAVLKGRGIKAIPLSSLRPLDAGKFTGEKKSEHKEDMKYYHEHTDARIPGGESIDGMNKRVRPVLLKGLRAGVRTGKPSYFSAHSSVIHSLGNLLHGDHEHALVEPGGVVAVTFDGKKFQAKPVFKPKKEKQESAYAS
jgi:broad specificity phosphatase PhoE